MEGHSSMHGGESVVAARGMAMATGSRAMSSASWSGSERAIQGYSKEQRENIEEDIDKLTSIICGYGMDSKKTEELTRLLPTLHPKVECCFDGAGMWDSSQSRFSGAPDWDAIGRALERLKEEIHHEHMTIELDIDEDLIDALARSDSSGLISFEQFAMLLANADASG